MIASACIPRPDTVDNSSDRWTTEKLKQLNEIFMHCPPAELLRWGFKHFAPDIALATGFGPEGIVLMHQILQIRPETTMFYLDTDLLFPETYALRDELSRRYGFHFTRVHCGLSLADQEQQHGPELWARSPDRCCYLRKVEPLRRFLSTQRAWISGIRRDQTPFRANAQLIEWDYTNRIVKFNPLAYWHGEEVWDYIHSHQLPFNPLHTQGYPSIGCWPCTRPVAPGNDPRSGRWAGWAKTECGIHT